MQEIAKVTHYFNKIGVAVIELSGALSVGDTIKFEGKSDFEQTVDSMQVDHENIESANAGEEIGLKVKEEVAVGDKVLKI